MKIESIGPLNQPDPKGKSGRNFLRQDGIAKKHRQYTDRIELGEDVISTEKDGYDGSFKKTPVNYTYGKDLKRTINSNLNRKILSKPPELRHEKITEVKNKIARGFYDNPDNFASIADKIIDYYLNP
ncbi:MAG: hypothetical protein DRP26_01585 [Candidatus Zixiibacteriota bacterium]|nr:MAG: hypothetical protein DRP26_01585 [candidate division Zixibacteria bacterium]